MSTEEEMNLFGIISGENYNPFYNLSPFGYVKLEISNLVVYLNINPPPTIPTNHGLLYLFSMQYKIFVGTYSSLSFSVPIYCVTVLFLAPLARILSAAAAATQHKNIDTC